MRHVLFKKLMKFQQFLEIFHCCLTRLRNKKKGFFLSCLLIRTTSRKESTGQRNFQKHFKFHNFSEIFYCGTTRPWKTNLGVFIQRQYTRTILKNKNMGQSLFRKHWKFQNFDEIFYAAWPDSETPNLYVVCFHTMLIHKRTISSKKNLKQSQLKKQTKFLTFNKVFLPWRRQTWHG